MCRTKLTRTTSRKQLGTNTMNSDVTFSLDTASGLDSPAVVFRVHDKSVTGLLKLDADDAWALCQVFKHEPCRYDAPYVSPRQMMVMLHRLDGLTLQEIADRYKVKRER